MAHFKERIKQQSGMVLGGIGTGSIELLPDGELHEWQIYNTERWTTCHFEEKVDDGEAFVGALSFFVRTEDKQNGILCRRLGYHCHPDEFTHRMFTKVKPVEEIDFDCRFPTAELTYHDRDLPVLVKSRFTSPFVPHHEDLSASPAFSVEFIFTNPTDHTVKTSLCAKLKTNFCNPAGETHSLSKQNGATCISVFPKETSAANDGSLALSIMGDGKTSYLLGDYTRYLDEYVSHSPYGLAQESFLFPFIKSGYLPNTEATEALVDNFFTLSEAESEEALDARLATLARYAFANSLLDRIRAVYPTYPADSAQKREFIAICARQVRDISRGREKPFAALALANTISLKPHESKTVRLVFSWYFPNHFNQEGRLLGHYYTNLYKDALDVNRTMIKKYNAVFGAAQSFSRLLYNTSLPICYPDAWSVHLGTIVKDSWWIQDKRFGLWEGLGYCGFVTTDITYHASFSLAALFPELQKIQMRMTAEFQREDGRMPHFFRPDLYHVDNGFHRVDMNPQYVLLAARDYLLHGDKEQLKHLWNGIVSAMDATARLDQNGDGLPDTDTGANTYDAWRFRGTPAYIAFLWLGALKAAIYLADCVEDSQSKVKWQALLEKGTNSVETLLYNGKYYDLWKDGDERDACLMSDQLDGEIFLHLIGLEGNLPKSRLKDVIRYIHKYNVIKGEGLVNATCPKGTQPTMFTYQNCQVEAHWTGIAYLFAAALDKVGEHAKATDLIETVHECQGRLGYFFNHWECGFRYTRPLSSFATLLAVSGFSYDCENGILTLAPCLKETEYRFPVFTAEGMGCFEMKNAGVILSITEGRITLQNLRLTKETSVQSITLSGTPLSFTVKKEKEHLAIKFASPITLTAGVSLTVQ